MKRITTAPRVIEKTIKRKRYVRNVEPSVLRLVVSVCLVTMHATINTKTKRGKGIIPIGKGHLDLRGAGVKTPTAQCLI